MAERQRYAVVGTGSRARLYIQALAGNFPETAQLVALCDTSQVRMAWHARQVAANCLKLPCYSAEDFGLMLKETRPDVVVVATIDCFHAPYIVTALEQGCDVVSEKPLALRAEHLEEILDAERRSGRKVRAVFNARYAAEFSAIRRLLLDGRIGTVHLVEMTEILDVSHGADYFRRWHRQKASSGGLLVHKACHHFDLVNWWLGDLAQDVFASGSLSFYGKQNADRRGERYPYDRYTGVPEAAHDRFALRLDRDGDGPLRGLYLDAEEETGYIRDRNVFAPDIDIEDTAAVTVRYRQGALLSYSLVAYSPWEGMRLALTGDRGRIQLDQRLPSELHGTNVPPAGAGRDGFSRLSVATMFGEEENIDVGTTTGGHKEADAALVEDLFGVRGNRDPLGRGASVLDGAAAALIGDAANRSVVSGERVDCASLLDLMALR
jgi:predicted dehydrogenase